MIDFSQMLPVGMVTHGGQVAQILGAIAKRKRGLSDWEAFHYERLSESSFELTGGIVSNGDVPGAGKRWLEPHECITVSMAELLAELQLAGLLTPDMTAQATQPPVPAVSNSGADAGALAAARSDQGLLHVTLALPKDEAGRQRILRSFHLQADFFGAQVVACRLD
jgi:hypothetical protein